MSEKVEYGKRWLILDPDTFVVIGSMTAVEKECRDAWAAADPERVTWTATRFSRIPPPKVR